MELNYHNMKRLQDTIAESLLDLDDKIMDRGLIEAWIKDNTDCRGLKLNDDLSIDATNISVVLNGPIPDYIKFNKIGWLCYSIYVDIEEVWLKAPKTTRRFQVNAHGDVGTINFTDNFDCLNFTINGSVETINLPKRFKCDEFLCSDSTTSYINGIKGLKARDVQLSANFIKNLLLETLKFPKDSNIKVYGRTL